MKFKKSLHLIAGFYKNEVPSGIGIQLEEYTVRELTNGLWGLDRVALEISNAVNRINIPKEEVITQLENYIAASKKGEPNIAILIPILAAIEWLEMNKHLQPDDTNGMMYQTSLEFA